jgi:hypothetical protein
MTKKLTIFVFAFVMLCAAFIFGRFSGEHAATLVFRRTYDHMSSLNSIGAYSLFADISSNLSTQKNADAKCLADVAASAYFDQIQRCLNEVACRDFIREALKKDAPDLLNGNAKKFVYHKNREQCIPPKTGETSNESSSIKK